MRIEAEQRRRAGWIGWHKALLFYRLADHLLDVGFARYYFVWGKAGMSHERYRRALSLTSKGAMHFGGKIGSLKNKEAIEKRGNYWYPTPLHNQPPHWFELYQMTNDAIAAIRKRARGQGQ